MYPDPFQALQVGTEWNLESLAPISRFSILGIGWLRLTIAKTGNGSRRYREMEKRERERLLTLVSSILCQSLLMIKPVDALDSSFSLTCCMDSEAEGRDSRNACTTTTRRKKIIVNMYMSITSTISHSCPLVFAQTISSNASSLPSTYVRFCYDCHLAHKINCILIGHKLGNTLLYNILYPTGPAPHNVTRTCSKFINYILCRSEAIICHLYHTISTPGHNREASDAHIIPSHST